MFGNLSIKARLIFVIGMLSALLIVIGAIGLRGMSTSNESLSTVYADRLVPADQLYRINNYMQDSIRQMQLASMHDPRTEVSKLHDHPIGRHIGKAEENRAESAKIWKEYLATYLTPEEKSLADLLAIKQASFVEKGLKPTEALYTQGKYDEANAMLFSSAMPLYAEAKEVMDKLMALQLKVGSEEFRKAEAFYKVARVVAIAAIIGGVLLSAIVGFLMVRNINQSLLTANEVAGRIAEGDLSGRIVIRQKDEIGRLLASMQHMQDSLINIVRQVRADAHNIANASTQIASGNQDLSSRTEQQASSLEETASSMEELTSTVRQNADNARQANQLAVSASDIAVKGGAVVGQVVDTMDAINASSKKIVDIITVIDGIAFQTNILALNAAVEAARAGEQGRGFAVVASEVRNLAQRSASAAREIKALIDDSVEKVESGSKLVHDAGATMQEVVASIKRVHDIMGEITAASHEQSEGIEQVNQAIVQMDTVTQQNAALVEEAAAATESLQDQARNLVEAVSVFKTGDSQTMPANSIAKPKTRAMTAGNNVVSVAKKPVASVAHVPLNKPIASRSASGDDWEEF